MGGVEHSAHAPRPLALPIPRRKEGGRHMSEFRLLTEQ